MARTSYILAWLSLAVGVALVIATVVRQGPAFSVGTLLGVLLVANAVVRFWVLRSGRAR